MTGSGGLRPGPLNLITDVPGLRVGQAHDEVARTGVSVILPDDRAVCAVDVRGGGPGTRETDALAPENLVDAVDAVVLSGGSVYGLGAADGVAAWLGAVYLLGRFLYWRAYVTNPARRGLGFLLSMGPTMVLAIGALVGIVRAIVASAA